MDPKPKPTNKIIIAIPFWSGDKIQAMKLARLMADLQPVHSTRADIVFCARFDCKHDMETVEYVSRKFNVHVYTSPRREVGWPHGCNGMFFGLMEWFYGKITGRIPDYRAMFIAESDGAPLSDDWLSRLTLEWDKINEQKPVCMAGAMLPDVENNHPHINGGCAFMSGDHKFLKWIVTRVGGLSVRAGWDWVLTKQFETIGWSDMPSIKSEWHRPTFTAEEWSRYQKRGVVWLHGLKDDSLLDLARKNLL